VGHQLIADIAWHRLPATTQRKVAALLELEPGATLVSVASWADQVRSPQTAAWHYVNFAPEAGCKYSDGRDCPDGRCVVGALGRQLQRLQMGPSPEERLLALKWIVHLVGDVHQPLHASPAGNKGGNLLQVRAFGRGTNLHAVWDSGFINHWPGGLPALREAAARGEGAAVRSIAPETWAEESCKIASSTGFAPAGRRIDEEFEARWSNVLAARIQAAAERLADVLTRALP
jgi:hypothetical protein